jgi:hypothetical protein
MRDMSAVEEKGKRNLPLLLSDLKQGDTIENKRHDQSSQGEQNWSITVDPHSIRNRPLSRDLSIRLRHFSETTGE